MNWIKKGRIFTPLGKAWQKSHAQNPFAEQISPNTFRFYYSTRDKLNRARGASFHYNLVSGRISKTSKSPILDLGRPGAFDDCGVMPSCIINYRNTKYLYYTGWSQAVKVPFTFFIGLAVSNDNGKTFERYSEAPVLGRNIHDPFLTAAPWVIRDKNVWKMWYTSATHWELKDNSKASHYYHIKYAESKDGISWTPKGVAISFLEDEYALARPVVYKKPHHYEMWFCSRGGSDTYRARFATSKNGKNWLRDSSPIINLSSKGWDSNMICYPFILEHKNNKYLFYNGNDYGATGIGYALNQS